MLNDAFDIHITLFKSTGPMSPKLAEWLPNTHGAYSQSVSRVTSTFHLLLMKRVSCGHRT